MRVLTVVENLGPGGTQRAAQNYALGYLEAGRGSAVLTLRGGGPRVDAISRAGVEVFVGAGGAPDPAWEGAIAWGPDVVHIHRFGRADALSGGFLRRVKASRPNCRVVETNVFARVDYSADRDLIDLHLHLSRWCLWKWTRWSRPLRPAPLGAIVPYAVDTEAFFHSREEGAAFRHAHGLPPDAFVFTRVGQPIEWKWHPAIFPAFADAARRLPAARLLLAGLPAELRGGLEAMDEEVRSRVVEIPFLQGDDALRACYSASDAFVHAAAIGETFGMVLAETMLCECPVVTLSRAARDNSQLEVVGHGLGGIVVARASNLADAMVQLAESPRRLEFGKVGAASVRARFSMDVVMSLLLRAVDLVVASADRDALRRALRDSPELVTDVADEEIESLLALSLGAPSRLDRLMMRLVHQPDLYRAFHRIKHG